MPDRFSIDRQRGFTLIEVVVAMVVATIITGFIAMFLVTPVQAYLAQTRRSELSDSAEAAMRYIADDVRIALPNSVRWGAFGTVRYLEMIELSAIGTYRENWPDGDSLRFGVAEGSFDVVGGPVVTGPTRHIVIDNRRNAARSAYRLVDVATPADRVITPTATGFSIAPTYAFRDYGVANRSANQRAYAVSGVTRYECDLNARTLVRYQNLSITNPAVAAPAGPATLIAETAALVGQPVFVASASTLPSVETAPFTVVPGLVSPDRSSVEVRPDALRTCCDTADVIVTARDAAGNSVPGASVTLATNDAQVFVVNPLLPTDANGIAVGRVAARAIGTKSVSATIAGVEVAGPATVEVSAGLVFRLLLLRVGEIVTTYPDRSQPANLSRTPRPEDDPSWAPDGSRVAYVVTPCSECETEIYSMSADGTDTLNLTANLSGNAFSPAWSNDGSSIAFTAEAQVFLMNADGSNPTNLTGEGGGSHPAWSPGGERIAYTRRVCDTVCRDDIWVRQLAQDTASILSGALNGLSTAPAFSPDGRTIAFAFRPCETCVADVYTMSAVDGSNVIPLTRGSPGSVESLDWSPDGAQIVFATECTSAPCDGELYVMNADGSGLDQLGPGSHPDWR